MAGAISRKSFSRPWNDSPRRSMVAKNDPGFWDDYVRLVSDFCGRPTPVTFAENLTRRFGGARIYIKREDLNHTGAHKANNVMGQGLLARRMGKAPRDRRNRGGPAWGGNRHHGGPFWISSAPSTWAMWTAAASGPTSSGWSGWAQRWSL